MTKRRFWSLRPSTARGVADAIWANFLLHWFPARMRAASLAWLPTFWLGTASWVLFVILLLSGLPLMVFYVPSVEDAYRSVKDIEYVESADASLVLRGDRGFATLALIGDERNSLTDPRRGLFWTATVELARTALGSDVDYHRLYGQLFAYLPIGPVVWAQGYRLGAVPGSNPLLLLDNRFRAGGPTTVRGFEQNALGPQTVEGDSIGGQAVAVVNQELRFPLWKRLKGGLFWDAGNVWLTSKELDLADLRQSVGVGLRYMFPFGPLRLEYAWVVNPRPGEAKGRFVLGLGHAF